LMMRHNTTTAATTNRQLNQQVEEDADDATIAAAVKDCVVVSNCARFELLLAVDEGKSIDSGDETEDDPLSMSTIDIVKKSLSRSLLRQVRAYERRKKKNPLLELQLNFDSPGWIVNDDLTEIYVDEGDVLDICNSWTVMRGSRDVARHLCLIAAGMASRPRRPDRPVVFRPFSSRDAHILLQLKRTLDGVVTTRTNGKRRREPPTAMTSASSSSDNVCSTLLRFALRAGKAARNIDKIPELAELRKYGTGDNSKFASEPPAQLARHVEEVT